MSEEQKKKLESKLWAIADELRSKMNADEYRNYILGFIFYKYLSEKQEAYAEELLKSDKVDFTNLDSSKKKDQEYIAAVKKHSLETLGFFLEPAQLFSCLVRKGKGEVGNDTFILEELKAVLNAIESTSAGTESEEDFRGLFADVDLTSVKLGSSEKKKNELIVEILSHLSEIDFKLEDSKSDVLGDAYEYLIAQFAAGAGKKAGEFYTPSQVSRLMAKIVTDGKKKLRSVYDPTCGSGSLLLRLGEYATVTDYYGQELNNTTYNLARMNMILHGVHFSHFKIENGDTLMDDKLPDLKAEAVVANPPFSADWKGDEDPVLTSDERFSQYGRLAPKSYADFAFVTHMLHHLSDRGVMAVVLPHGALYRPDAEEIIREHLIEKLNYVDAIIGLPPNLFYGTTYATVIMVLKKCRENDDIFFVDASRDFEVGVKQSKLADTHLEKIFRVYKLRKEIEKYSRKVSIDEIKINEFNLNFPRYLDIFERTEQIDINATAEKIIELETKEKLLAQKLTKLCNELSLTNPFTGEVSKNIANKDIRYTFENGKEFPMWEKIKFSELYDFIPTNSLPKSKLNLEDGAVKNIQYGFIHGKKRTGLHLSSEEIPFINREEELKAMTDSSFLREFLRDGDLLIADASEDYDGAGKVLEVMSTGNERVVAGLHTILARPKTRKLSSGFMSVYTKSNLYRDQIKKIAQGTKVLGVPKKYLREIIIHVPSIEEQERIAEGFQLVEGILDELQTLRTEQKDLTKAWESGLLQKMFV